MRPRTCMPLMALCAALTVAACAGPDRDTTTADRSTAGGDVATTGVRVSDVKLGRAIGADNAVTDEEDEFRPTDVVYASVHTTGSASGANLRARWTFQDGQVVDETTRTINPSGDAVTEFHISKPDGLPRGKYRVEIYLDDQQVGNEEFEVRS